MKASLGHIRKPKDISGAEQLSSLQYVSEEFAEPNPRLIQFVVEIKGMNAIIRAISGFKT
jgi:hypothetical protein